MLWAPPPAAVRFSDFGRIQEAREIRAKRSQYPWVLNSISLTLWLTASFGARGSVGVMPFVSSALPAGLELTISLSPTAKRMSPGRRCRGGVTCTASAASSVVMLFCDGDRVFRLPHPAPAVLVATPTNMLTRRTSRRRHRVRSLNHRGRKRFFGRRSTTTLDRRRPLAGTNQRARRRRGRRLVRGGAGTLLPGGARVV